MLHKTKTLTTVARQKKAKEKALKRTSQTGKEHTKTLRKEQSLQNDKRNNKTTKKKSSD